MIIKNKSLGILAGFLLVLTLISFASACDFQMVVESPEDNSVYNLGEDVLLKAQIFSTSNIQIKIAARVFFPDGSFETIYLEQNEQFYEAVFTPSTIGDYSVKFRAEDAMGNVQFETRNFEVKDSTPFNNLELIVNSPDEGAIYNLGEQVFFDVEVTSLVNVQIKVLAKVMFPDGSVDEFYLYEDAGNYQYVFDPNLEGDYKVSFYAEDIFGNSDFETRNFKVKKEIIPSSDLNLIIISPDLGSEFELLEDVLFEAKVEVSGDVEKEVWVVLEKQGGFEMSFDLMTSDEIFYSKIFDNLEEGKYIATFYVKDNFGNSDSEQTSFSVIDNLDDDFGIFVEDDDKYYVCTLWSLWSSCKNGYQERTCLEEKIVDYFSDDTSVDSWLGFTEFRSCVTGYQISSDVDAKENSYSFDLFYWLALFLALFVLIGFILVVIVLKRR